MTLRKQRNILVLGFSMVGKTAICQRFATDTFADNYEPTYENSFHRTCTWKGQEIDCTIKDTQGLSDQDLFRHEYALGYHGYILVYSISSQRSLKMLRTINDKLVNLTGNVPRVLVGNKRDLDFRELAPGDQRQREVSREEGAATAADWGCAFVECSAKYQEHGRTDVVFQALFDEIDRTYDPPEEPRSALSGVKCFDLIQCCGFNESEVGETSRLEKIVRSMITLTMAFGMAAILAGVIIGIQSGDHEGSLLAYILFGFGMIVSLISALGLFGVRHSSQEFLRVYAVSLSIVIVTEVVVWFILFANIHLFQHYTLQSAIAAGLAIAAEILAITFVCCYQTTLHANIQSSPYHYQYGSASPYLE